MFLDKRRGGVHPGGRPEHPGHLPGSAEVQGELQRQNCGAGAPPQGRGHPERCGQGGRSHSHSHVHTHNHGMVITHDVTLNTPVYNPPPKKRVTSKAFCGQTLTEAGFSCRLSADSVRQRAFVCATWMNDHLSVCRLEWKPKKPPRPTSPTWRNTPPPSRTLNRRWRKLHRYPSSLRSTENVLVWMQSCAFIYCLRYAFTFIVQSVKYLCPCFALHTTLRIACVCVFHVSCPVSSPDCVFSSLTESLWKALIGSIWGAD